MSSETAQRGCEDCDSDFGPCDPHARIADQGTAEDIREYMARDAEQDIRAREADDEIAALRADLERTAQERDAAQATIERLRAELENARDVIYSNGAAIARVREVLDDADADDESELYRQARAAIEGETE